MAGGAVLRGLGEEDVVDELERAFEGRRLRAQGGGVGCFALRRSGVILCSCLVQGLQQGRKARCGRCDGCRSLSRTGCRS